MGSSVSGSLDKYAKFSPAAALGSGKVKLPGGPTGGIIGMLQEDMIGSAEAKQAQKAANMQMMQQEQNQNNQYNMALQQMMMGQQQKPSPYSPAPYANGGNVTLRRKMFKLGGSASAHGTGLTSGLEFNQGGSVRQNFGKGKLVKPFLDYIFGRRGPKPSGREIDKYIDTASPGILQRQLDKLRNPIRYTMGDPSKVSKNFFLRQGGRGLRALDVGTLGAGAVGIPGAALMLAGDYGDPSEEAKGSGAERALRALRMGTETALDFSAPGFAFEAIDYLTRDPSTEGPTDLSDFLQGRPRDPVTGSDALAGGREIEDDISSSELAERIATQDAERMREAMEMYQELIRGEDNTNKLATLGDALIAGGSSLLEGEGYGAAASAFNQPLSQARVGQEAADAEARAAAAQLAIGEDMSRRQADQELSMNLLAAGDLNTEEEIQAVLTARSVGISQRLPEDDKGEVDEAALRDRGVGVYVDPRQRYGKLFVAINSSGIPDGVVYTNDPEKAKQHAKS